MRGERLSIWSCDVCFASANFFKFCQRELKPVLLTRQLKP
jgi:hypothetical protein